MRGLLATLLALSFAACTDRSATEVNVDARVQPVSQHEKARGAHPRPPYDYIPRATCIDTFQAILFIRYALQQHACPEVELPEVDIVRSEARGRCSACAAYRTIADCLGVAETPRQICRRTQRRE